MSPRLPRPADGAPSGDASKEAEAEIERIDEIIRIARTTWFALLAALVFVGVTLASARDIAFFVTSERTQLPLVDISVPVTSFFTAGSVLIAAFYTYFHVYLERLWRALGSHPARVGGKPLADCLHPWVVVDAALRWRDDLRKTPGDKRCSTPHRMAPVGDFAAIVLVWLFGPEIAAAFWWRSMPAHDLAMTGLLAIVLVVTLGVFLRSGTATYAYLAGREPGRRWWLAFVPAVLAIGVLTVTRTTIDPWAGEQRGTVVSLFRCPSKGPPADETADASPSEEPAGERFCWTGFDIRLDILRPAPANLREAVFTEKPKDWLGLKIAETEFRVRWCEEKRGLECDNPLIVGDNGLSNEEEKAFQKEWTQRRAALLAAMPKPDLRGKDLRGADLGSARLEGANLRFASLEGANLSFASLEGANLARARLESANLRFASLEGANLSFANLAGANLARARLESANLRFASLEGANLSFASLEGNPDTPLTLNIKFLSASRWFYSALRDVKMDAVDMTGLRDFSTSFGDGSVVLPLTFSRPCQWSNDRLDDDAFFGRWRGWLELNGLWGGLFPELDAYAAIPPPQGCGPVAPEEPDGAGQSR